MRKLPIIAAFAGVIAAAPPVFAEEEGESRGILPSEEEMRQLGALAEKYLRDFADEVSPMIERLDTLIDDLDRYEAPEMLPNGDIIIRRRPDAPPFEPSEDGSVAL